jgi:hypothetical protein
MDSLHEVTKNNAEGDSMVDSKYSYYREKNIIQKLCDHAMHFFKLLVF